MPTETETVKKTNGHPRNILLGFRLLVEPLRESALLTSWLYIPASQQQQVILAKVIQVGKFRKTKSRKGRDLTAEQREGRGEIEVKPGQDVLISTEKGNYPLPVDEGNRRFLICSYRDVLAIITEPEPEPSPQNPSVSASHEPSPHPSIPSAR